MTTSASTTEKGRGGVAGSGIGIIAGSACSVPPEVCEAYGIQVVPLQITYPDGSTYRDRVDIQPAQIYARMPAEMPQTSLPSAASIYDAVEKLRAQGCTAVLAVTLGSAYSGTHGLVERILGEQEGLRGLVYDTGKLDYGAGVSAVMAAKAIEAGMPFDDLKDHLDHLAQGSGSLVTVSTLDYLVAGGRIGRAKGAAGDLLNVRPIMGCTPGGLAQIARARGTKAALKQLVAEAAERVAGYPRVIARVVHTDEPDLGQEVAARLRAAVPGAEVKVSEASAVIGAHTGPGAVGICYQGLDAGEPLAEPW